MNKNATNDHFSFFYAILMPPFTPLLSKRWLEKEQTLVWKSGHNCLRKPIKCAADRVSGSDHPDSLALKGS